jgi:hypothetical protein
MTSDRTGRPIHQGPPSGSAVRHLTQPCLVGHGLTYAFKNRYCSFARTLTATSKGMHTMRLEAARLQAILEGELMSGSADARRTARAGPNNCPPASAGASCC